MVVLNGITGNQSACPSQSRLAVHCHCTRLSLDYPQKFLDNFLRRTGAIGEIELIVPNSRIFELGRVVGLVVEPHHSSHAQFFEYRHIVLWRKKHVLNGRTITPESSFPES